MNQPRNDSYGSIISRNKPDGEVFLAYNSYSPSPNIIVSQFERDKSVESVIVDSISGVSPINAQI